MPSSRVAFAFSNSTKQHSCGAVRVGSATRLHRKETSPVCKVCKKYLTLLVELNHNALPLSGLMKSEGISRLFICANTECTSFADNGSFSTGVLQSSKELHWAEEGK